MFVLSLLEEFGMVEWKGRSGSWEDEVRKLADWHEGWVGFTYLVTIH